LLGRLGHGPRVGGRQVRSIRLLTNSRRCQRSGARRPQQGSRITKSPRPTPLTGREHVGGGPVLEISGVVRRHVAEAWRLYSSASIWSRANVAPRRWQSCSGVRGDLREFATAPSSCANVFWSKNSGYSKRGWCRRRPVRAVAASMVFGTVWGSYGKLTCHQRSNVDLFGSRCALRALPDLVA
jgi:hypothetical protein